jgi:hypothetical protein
MKLKSVTHALKTLFLTATIENAKIAWKIALDAIASAPAISVRLPLSHITKFA